MLVERPPIDTKSMSVLSVVGQLIVSPAHLPASQYHEPYAAIYKGLQGPWELLLNLKLLDLNAQSTCYFVHGELFYNGIGLSDFDIYFCD